MTNCTPGKPCSCGARKTVRAFNSRLAQRYLWGTSDSEADYGRRTFIETVNSYVKSQIGKIDRSSIRLMGRAKMTLAVGTILAIINMRMIRSRYDIGLANEHIPRRPGPQAPTPQVHRTLQAEGQASDHERATTKTRRPLGPTGRDAAARDPQQDNHTAVTASARDLALPMMPRSHPSGAFRVSGHEFVAPHSAGTCAH